MKLGMVRKGGFPPVIYPGLMGCRNVRMEIEERAPPDLSCSREREDMVGLLIDKRGVKGSAGIMGLNTPQHLSLPLRIVYSRSRSWNSNSPSNYLQDTNRRRRGKSVYNPNTCEIPTFSGANIKLLNLSVAGIHIYRPHLRVAAQPRAREHTDSPTRCRYSPRTSTTSPTPAKASTPSRTSSPFPTPLLTSTNSPSFPPPKIFTNALLANHDITSLLRDTEAHERALFSVPPPPPPSSAPQPDPTSRPSNRRQTVFNVSSGEVTTGAPTSRAAPRRNAAVAAVLGGEMHERITRGVGGEVDVEALLEGAERLCGVYEVPGALRRIAEMRGRGPEIEGRMAYYEEKVREQGEMLEAMNKNWRGEDYGEEQEEEAGDGAIATEEQLRGEEEEVRELERRKRELQARLKAMEKDLGGLMNM